MRRRFLVFRNFHTKLFVSYSLIVIVLTVAVAVPTYYYLKERLVRNQNALVEQVFDSSINTFSLLESQFDSYTKQMYLIRGYGNDSNATLVEQLLGLNHQTADKFTAVQSAKNFIALGQEINKNWGRISIILEDGTIFSNQDVAADPANAQRERWLDDARRLGGAIAADYGERDPYGGSGGDVPMFALSRLLKVGPESVGVIQVQVEASRIFDSSKLSAIPFDQIVIYSGSTPIYALPEAAPTVAKSGQSVYYRQSQSGNFALHMTVGLKRLYAPIRNFQWVMIAIVAFLVLFSLLIYYFLSRILTSPLKRIRAALDSLQLSGEDDSGGVDLNQSYYLDEMERLNRSFRKMNARLQQSLTETVHFRNLQLQSRFDLLQSQIHPHFLFNMLGVIQVLADHNENRLASGVCLNLAEFLKYTISDHQTVVPIKEEFRITEMYLELMKSRYQHRLDYRVSLSEDVADVELPKLVIQPLVENSLKHGFRNLSRPMRIEVEARKADDRLIIEVKDNGAGFEPGKYAEVTEAIKRHGDALARKIGVDGLSVGGMGIASAFIRLKLLYGERVELRLETNEAEGVVIRIALTLPRGGEPQR